jgi:hypothetical protein
LQGVANQGALRPRLIGAPLFPRQIRAGPLKMATLILVLALTPILTIFITTGVLAGSIVDFVGFTVFMCLTATLLVALVTP